MASPAWASTREWWRSHRSSWRRRCRVCGSRRYELHHRTYMRLGAEKMRDLVPLCDRHHVGVHSLEKVLMFRFRRDVALMWATRLYVGAVRRVTWVLVAIALVLVVL